jgi:ABC-type Fe3+/spermidine/putrescine transport system ATPase subunit
VLLLDEPLGALDARLRKDLQVELKTLQVELGVTFVFVTHDQEEALTMSDRVAVMNGGRVEQAGSPQSIYEEPATVFVADFLGVSNLLSADCASGDAQGVALKIGDRTLQARQGAQDIRGPVKAMIRPERVGIEAQGGNGANRLPGMVEHSVFLGSFRELHVRLVGGDLVKAIMPNDGSPDAHAQGSPVTVHFPADALRVLPPTSADSTATGDTPDE